MTTIEETILAHLRALSPEDRRKVLQYSESLREEVHPRSALRSGYGLLGDLNVRIGEEEIAQLRHAMWSTFPREDIP